MMRIVVLSLILLLTSLPALTRAQDEAPAPGAQPPFDVDAYRAALEAYFKMPDTVGTGLYPAVKEMVDSLPHHVIYRPQDLSRLGETRLGVLAFGNGGCAKDGASARFHLAEIASHGYLVIASGTILSGPGAPPDADPFQRPADGSIPPPATSASMLTDALDWALAQNEDPGSPYHGRINPEWLAVSGWSCGGLQALEVASDPRIATVIIHNSGILPEGKSPNPEMDIGKQTLRTLHQPTLYILGGPTDIAYANGMDDYEHIDNVPVMVANLGVGHGGTFLDPNGGRAASVAVSWLDWQFRHEPDAAARFLGPDCGLCADSDWTLRRKGFPDSPP